MSRVSLQGSVFIWVHGYSFTKHCLPLLFRHNRYSGSCSNLIGYLSRLRWMWYPSVCPQVIVQIVVWSFCSVFSSTYFTPGLLGISGGLIRSLHMTCRWPCFLHLKQTSWWNWHLLAVCPLFPQQLHDSFVKLTLWT